MKRITMLLVFLMALGLQVFAQSTVTGTVTGANDGQALPGVTVSVKGFANAGTITDASGNYSLRVPEGGNTLMFTFIGMKAKSISIGGQSVINAQMESDDIQVDDVIVTAVGIKRDKKALGYSVQDVSGEEFTKAKEANFVNSLSGRVAGVQITNSSGAVGASSRIVLRGATSITGNNEPLFVVDGIPINNSSYGNAGSGGGFDAPSGAAGINADDIESVAVLKGANAAALYGSRAANGVILITTKKGKGSKGLGVSVNSSLTFETPLKLPDFQNSYGQGASNTHFEFIDGQHGDGGVDESWGMPLDIGLDAVQFTTNGETPEPWISTPNNIKDFFDLGMTHTNNVALTGGSDVGSFRLSFTNMGQKGIVPNTDYNKITINGSADAKLTDKFSVGMSFNYIKSYSDNLPTVGYNNENPVQQMIWAGRQVDFNALRDYENLPLSDATTAAGGTPLNWNTIFQNNPYWVLNTNLNQFDKDRIIGNFHLKYDFTDYLSVRMKTGTDYWSSKTTQRQAQGSNNAPNGFYNETFRNWYETNSEALVMFNKNIGSDISLNINVGGNQMKQVYNRIYGEASQLELAGVYNLSNVKSGTTAVLTNTATEERINSVYLSGQVGFRDYLYLEFSARNDWSSVLPVENNSFFYPSVSLSADITEMAGIQSPVLSFFKLRGSYAIVGGATALNPYSLQQTYGFRDDPWGSVLLPFNGNTLNNPNIKPEATNSMEFGFDARFFDSRVTLDATYYNSVSTDLIVPVQVTAATGYQFAYDNVGEMANSGFELQLGADLIKTNDLVFNVTVNFSAFSNEVVSLGDLETLVLGGQWNMTLEAREGLPYGVIYGPAFERSPAGEIVYSNGLPVIAEENKVLGDIQPDWTGGIRPSLTYKGLSLSALVDAKMGGEIHSMTTTWGRYAGILSETVVGRETGIVGEGVIDNGDGTFSPNNVVVSSEAFNKAAYSNDVVESAVFDASYVKLRQVSLGYNVPNKLLSKLAISDMNISLVGRNLAILYSKIPHIDPETGFSSANAEQGQEFGQLPSTRSFGFNINFKF